MQYRSDLQILRGIAIILVIGYHISSDIFKSGFFGVDIFFVLSGFLITKIYQNYNLKKYILNRLKRLMPAYFVSLIFITILSSIFLNFKEFNEVIREYFFASAFLSNLGFWAKNSYFNNSNFYPLLHFWSLSIEMQFYIIYPFIFYFLYKRYFLLFFVLIASFVCCTIILTISPKTAFYFIPFRIWEFLFGMIICKIKIKNIYLNAKYNYILLVPLIYICFTNTSYESHNFYYSHPGLKSFFVCINTSLIILLGLPNITFLKLPNLIFEKIGLISYSLYLYHFPIIVFYNYVPYEGNKYNLINYTDLLILIPLILIISIISYFFVEKFFRKRNFLFILFFILLSMITIIISNQYKNSLYSLEEKNIYNAFYDKGEFRCGKIFRIINPTKKVCKLNKNINSKNKFLLIGNSHANSLKEGMIDLMNSNNYELYFIVQNDPMMNATLKSLKPREIYEIAKKNNIENFIIHYDDFSKFRDNIREFLLITDKKGMKNILITPVPQNENNSPKKILESVINNHKLKLISYGDYRKKNDYIYDFLNDLELKNFKMIDIGKLLCLPYCPIFDSKKRPLYFDPGHLTISGSLFVNEKIKKQF